MKRTLIAMFLGAAMLLAAPIGNAALLHYAAFLDGPSEAPPNASPGTGFATVTIDDIAHTMDVHVDFGGLVFPTSVAHIHCCVAAPGIAGVATPTPTFPGFPGGAIAGAYDAVFDLTLAASFNAAFIAGHGGTPAGAEAALIAGLTAEMAYFNIHTTGFPGGEIRGFFRQVPEPVTLALLGMGLGAGWLARRRRLN